MKSFSMRILICLLVLATGAHVSSAQQVQPLDPEWLQRMYAEGWEKMQEGVLQRDVGGGQRETFTYGVEGLQWVAEHFELQVKFLESRYKAFPREALAAVIAQFRQEILRLHGSTEPATAESFDGEELAECNPSFGGDAYAGPLSGDRGVAARASAYFHSECPGVVGDTFATAYAQASNGTIQDSRTQNDLKNGGTWIDSNANVSVAGSMDCWSWAEAAVSASGIYYLAPRQENYDCSMQSTRLTLHPSQVTLGTGSSGVVSRLLDEQSLAGDPRSEGCCEVFSVWASSSGARVNVAIIDLGAIHRIERIYLYDRNGSSETTGDFTGNFTVTAGSPSTGWTTTLASDPMEGYRTWKGFPNNPTNDPSIAYFRDDPALEFSGVETRYLRIVNPSGYVGVGEIVVYGTPVSTSTCP